ncbi:hypothetical protein CF68_34310 [Cupriavidus sp. SK-4]|nr:hypothetical protein CF68_34310 [Cupriavidus sp. SK-4]
MTIGTTLGAPWSVSRGLGYGVGADEAACAGTVVHHYRRFQVTIVPECMVPIEASARSTLLQIAEPWATRNVCIGTRRGKAITAATRALIRQLPSSPLPERGQRA